MTPTPHTTSVMNDIFRDNLNVIVDNVHVVQATSHNLVLGLATIEFLIFLYLSYGDDPKEVMQRAVEKLLMIFMVALISFNWGGIAGAFKGYIAGGAAGAGGGSAMMQSMNPAYVATDGLDKVSVIFSPEGQKAMMEGQFFKDEAREKRQKKRMENKDWTDQAFEAVSPGVSMVLNGPQGMWEGLADATAQLGTIIIVGLVFCGLGLLIIFVHFYIALQLFVLANDWYITVYITGLLVPFAVNKHTSPLASAALQGVVRKSVQLAVTLMVVSMFGKTISGLGLGPQPTMIDVLTLLLGSLTMAFMVKQIPQISGSIFAGAGGTIDVGGALQAAASDMGGRVAQAMYPNPPGGGGGGSHNNDDGGDDEPGLGSRVLGLAGGGLAVGKKGFELAGQGIEKLRGEGPGHRDAEPRSMQELHDLKMKESAQIDDTLEQKEMGPMEVDASGNVNEEEFFSSTHNVQAMEAVPQSFGYEAIDASQPPPMSGESATQEPNATQSMHGLARTQQMHAASASSIEVEQDGGDWDDVQDTSPDATQPKDTKE